jgi:hypothetical protein
MTRVRVDVFLHERDERGFREVAIAVVADVDEQVELAR